ncbi:MAG TPA: CDP-glycerol glycerophosphotransferase family protein, partial [Microlunatus sp.]|nr:CDP-glycerol glycerophosphotransferase family protein [Microlunatus sp.]
YSSVMFDFAVTRKPILLLTPDLATYRDSTRGFYLDFESTVPGPVCLDHAALERQLNALPTYFDRYGDRYDAFLARFAPRDDGHAAARVVDQVWAPAALRSPAPAGALD